MAIVHHLSDENVQKTKLMVFHRKQKQIKEFTKNLQRIYKEFTKNLQRIYNVPAKANTYTLCSE